MRTVIRQKDVGQETFTQAKGSNTLQSIMHDRLIMILQHAINKYTSKM